jgi:hypothetical protein
VAHGDATLGMVDLEGQWDYAVMGSVRHLASRLSDTPRPKGGASSGRWAPQTTPCSETTCPSSEEGMSVGGFSPKPPKTNPAVTHLALHVDDSGCIASPLPR